MKFVQRRGSTVHTFELGDESFGAFSDHSGADKAEFSFGGLDKEFGESRELRSGFKRAANALATALSSQCLADNWPRRCSSCRC